MAECEVWYKFLVEAEITMLDASISGRSQGITTGYRPNHNFGSPENNEMRMGQVTVANDEWIEPGETKKVKIQFVFPKGYLIDLKPGLTWRIQEGLNHVANGKVLQILSSDL